MLDFFADLFVVIISAIFLFGPLVLVIYILRRIFKKKKQQENNNQLNQDNIKVSTTNSGIDSEKINNEDIENILFDEDKEEIDEYYDNQYIPYRPKYLLTKNEWNFYKELKEIAKQKNLTVLAKIRMADLVEVEPMNKNNWKIYFNKISRKHVDFALARPENLRILLLIELDDYSHNQKQYERDRFIEAVYKKTGYKLLRVQNTNNLRSKIDDVLKQ